MNKLFSFLSFASILFFALCTRSYCQNTFKSEEDLKKQAEKLFEEAKYEEALPLFSQLLSLYQKDPNYNFKYGACLLNATEDKEKPLMYLSFAASKPNVDNYVYFHLGRALQLNYRFEEAIVQYQNFKRNASAKSIETSQVDLLIENCNHGKELLSHITKLQVLDKKDLKSSDFFMSYDLSDLGGKLVVKPEDFQTPIDIKKQDRSLMYLLPGANEYYFSSYGESEKNSRDIYKVVKLPSGEFSKPINLGPVINTNKDEDYPFMHPNGTTLYFCSRGHNSMGGYDIYRSEWNPATSTWSKPINLDFAINSPDDDIMFISNKDNTLAYFASKRSSITGRTHIYKIKLDEQKEEILLVSGKLNLPPGKELTANIQLRDLNAKRKIIGIYQTNKQTGQYVLSVPNGGNVEITVEVPNYATLTRAFEVPKLSDFTQTLKQEITENPNDANSLVLNNRFNEKTTEEDRNFALAFIKQSANLDVNFDPGLEEINKEIENKEALNENKISQTEESRTEEPLASNEDTNNEINSSSVTNTKIENKKTEMILSESVLVSMAYEDAKESQQEANELKNEAIMARQVANKKKQSTEETKALLALTKTKTEALEPGPEKENGLTLIKELEEKLKSLEKQSEISEAIASKLEENAKKKQAEADADLKYANDLETAVNSKSDKTAIAKLTEQRRQIEEATPDYSADTQYEEVKEAFNAKQQEIERNNIRITELNKEIQDLENEKNSLVKEQGKTKDKNVKQTLSAQISEIEAEQQSKRNQMISAENNNKLLKIQLDSLSKQVVLVNDLVAEIKNVNPNNVNNHNNNAEPETIKSTDQIFNEITISKNLSPEVQKSLSEKSYLIAAENELKEIKSNSNELKANQLKLRTYQDLKSAIETDLTLLANSKQNAKSQTDKDMYNNIISELEKIKLNAENEIKIAESYLNSNMASSNTNKFEKSVLTQRTTNSESYQQQINQAQNISNPQEREEAILQWNREWLNALNAENEETRKQLQTANESEKEDLQEKLKEIALEINERKAAIKASEDRLTSINNQKGVASNKTNDISQQNSDELNKTAENSNTDSNNATVSNLQQSSVFNIENQRGNDLIPEGSNYNGIAYTSSESIQILKKFSPQQREEYQAQTIVLDSLRNSIAKAQTTEEKDLIKAQISAKAEERRELSIYLANLIGEANAAQINEQSKELKKLKLNAPETDKTVMADLLVEEAEYFFNEARAIREQIRSLDDSKNKESFMAKAYDLEKRAVEKQYKAYKLYTTAPEDQTIANNTQSVNNQKTINETTDNNFETKNQNNANAPSNESSLEINNTSNQPISTLETNEINTNTSSSRINSLNKSQKLALIDSVKQTEKYKTIELINLELAKQNDKTEMIKADYNSSINKYNEQLRKLNKAKEELDKADENNRIELASNLGVEQMRADSLRKIMQERRELYDNQKVLAQKEQENLNAELNKLDDYNRNAILLALNGLENEEPETNSVARTENKSENNENTFSNNTIEKTPDVQNIGPEKKEFSTTDANKNLALNNPKTNTEISTNNKSEVASKPATQSKSVNAPTKIEIVNNKIILPKTFEEVDAFFERTEFAAYSNENPIPIDVAIPEGLIFKVQIGAFRNPIPQDLFKGFNPVTGERTSSGIIRYTAGFFKKFNLADKAKTEIQAMGYRDAFVVAFYNGKRISVNEALALSKENAVIPNTNNQKTLTPIPPSQTETTEIKPEINPETNLVKNTVEDNSIKTNPQTGVKDLKTATGLVYTVQIGVYRNPVTPAQLYNVFPIYSEILPNGLIRYTSGLFKSELEAVASKNRIVTKGISDAFVVAFLNGKRISLTQARGLNNANTSPVQSNSISETQIKKDEINAEQALTNDENFKQKNNEQSQNVVVIPNENSENKPILSKSSNEENALNQLETIPDTGIIYKVQIGAFKNEVPNDIAILFLKVSAKGVTHYLDSDGLTHYTLGKVRTYREANELRQYAIQEGIEKPFIVSYKDGVKIDIETAKSLTNE